MHKFQSVEKFSFKERRFLNEEGGGESLRGQARALAVEALGVARKVVDKAGKALDDNDKPAAKPAGQPAVAPAQPVANPDAAAAQPAAQAQPAATPDSAGRPAVVEGGAAAQAKAADGEKPAKTAEIVDKGKRDLVMLQTELKDGAEQPKDPALFQKYLDAIDKIKGKVFTVEATASTLDFDKEKQRINNEIYAVYKDVDFSGLKDLFKIKEEKKGDFNNDMAAIVASALANSFINNAKENTKHLANFLKDSSGKEFVDQPITTTFSYVGQKAEAKFTGNAEFDAAYSAFAKAQPATEKPQDAAKAAEALKTDAEKIDFMGKTKIGKIMKMFGVKFDEVLSNKSPIAAMIFVLLGFGPKLGLGDSDMFKDLPDTEFTKGIKKTLEGFQKSGRGSAYGVDKDKVEGFNPGEVKAPEYEKFEGDGLVKVLKGEKLLDPNKPGMVIEKELKLGEGGTPKSVKVNLNPEGSILLPAGAKLIINGDEIIAPKDSSGDAKKDVAKAFNKDSPDCKIKNQNGIAVLTGVIPAGTVFTNKCKLSEEVPAVAPAK